MVHIRGMEDSMRRRIRDTLMVLTKVVMVIKCHLKAKIEPKEIINSIPRKKIIIRSRKLSRKA